MLAQKPSLSKKDQLLSYAGPDGVSDYKTRVEEQYHVGHGSMSPEATSDTLYLCRAASVSKIQYTDNLALYFIAADAN